MILHLRWRDHDWRHWLLTDLALGWGLLGGDTRGLYVAIALNLIELGRNLWQTRDLWAFPTQVRWHYTLMLIAGLWPPLQWILWLQLIGTTAMVLFNYCPLARLLVLVYPFNRSEPFSWALVRRTLLRPPVNGSIKAASENVAQ